MAQFVTLPLAHNEKIVLKTQLCWYDYIPYIPLLVMEAAAPCFIAAYASLTGSAAVWLGMAVAALTIPVLWLERIYAEYVPANRLVTVKTGVISRNVCEMPVGKIQSVDLFRRMAARILDCGSLALHGMGHTATVLKKLSQPARVRQALTGWK